MAVVANDAQVLPARVGRFYLAPTYAFVPGAFDEDGKYQKTDGDVTQLFNLGFALEYGIIDWITAGIQWVPGVNVWSEIGGMDKANLNGVADILAGARIQIVGPNAPVANETVRFAVVPGVMIPLPGPDYEEQMKNMAKNEKYTVLNADNHVFGVGGDLTFDYIINEQFFINLFGEFIAYPVKGKLSKSGLQEYMTVQGADAQLAPLRAQGMEASVKDEVSYGYDMKLELEPVFKTPLTDGILLTAGLPVTYTISAGKKYGGLSLDAAATAAMGGEAVVKAMEDQYFKDEEAEHLLTLTPNVSFFFTGWFLPTEFRLQYAIPVAGKNATASHSLTLLAKLYLKI
jgi:hypothetical protein